MQYWVGIDIGLQGGICCRSTTGQFSIQSMPLLSYSTKKAGKRVYKKKVDFEQVFKILCYFKGKNVHVSFEKLQGIFGASKKSSVNLAEQAGHFKAFCIALKLPYTEIHPKIWQAELFRGIDTTNAKRKSRFTDGQVTDTKELALRAFKKRFPDVPVPKKGKRILDGCIDSALICEYIKLKR